MAHQTRSCIDPHRLTLISCSHRSSERHTGDWSTLVRSHRVSTCRPVRWSDSTRLMRTVKTPPVDESRRESHGGGEHTQNRQQTHAPTEPTTRHETNEAAHEKARMARPPLSSAFLPHSPDRTHPRVCAHHCSPPLSSHISICCSFTVPIHSPACWCVLLC